MIGNLCSALPRQTVGIGVAGALIEDLEKGEDLQVLARGRPRRLMWGVRISGLLVSIEAAAGGFSASALCARDKTGELECMLPLC